MNGSPFKHPDPPACHEPPVSRTTINGVTTCSRCGTELNPLDLRRYSASRTSKQGIPSQWNKVPPRRPNNSFEKGNRLDERGLSYLNSSGRPIKMKEEFDKRKYDSSITIG